MDRNLEKNLRKIQALRDAGQDDRALKQLQEWARKHSDTPHYQYEAAMAAFDLGDYGVGLTALKGLLRAAPDTRERVLKACCDRFAASPNLPLGEFLVEQFLADQRVQDAFGIASQLAADQVEVYRKKTSMRHRSLVKEAGAPRDLARASHYVQLVIAHAARDPAAIAECIDELLRLDPTQAGALGEITQLELTQHSRDPRLLMAQGRCLLAGGRIAAGAERLADSCAVLPSEAPRVLELLRAQKPPPDQRSTWLRCVGEVALAARDGEAAASAFREAADLDPSLRGTLLPRLDAAPEPATREGLAALLKLRLRLQVVQRQYGAIPALMDRMLKEGLAPPDELRTLMGDGGAGAQKRPAELLTILAETALAACDLRAVAGYVSEVPDQDDHSLHKLLRVIEKAAAEWPGPDKLELLALRAIVQARVGDREAANQTLSAMWRESPDQLDALFAITERCLERVHPTPALLGCMLPAAMQRQRTDLVATALDSILRNTPEHVKWLVTDLVDYLDAHPDQAAGLLQLLDGCDKDLGAAQHLRYPVACAALLSESFARAIPEFQVLLMARPQLSGEVLERVRQALRRHPQDLMLNLSAYELLLEEQAWGEAAGCLGRALRADPSRVEEVSGRFDQLLAQQPNDLELWQAYADALFQVGRFAQLATVCARATQQLDASQQGQFHLLRARMMAEDGRLSEALDLVEELVAQDAISPSRAIEVVGRVATADPTNGRAALLLGLASAKEGLLDEAFNALTTAARADRNVVPRVAEELERLAARPAARPEHLVRLAEFHRWRGSNADAARALEQTLRLDATMAERVLGALARELEDPHGDLSLTMLGAKAARVAGRLEMACQLLTQVYSRDTQRFEAVLAELRKAAEDWPAVLLPLRTMARVLLAHHSPGAAAEVIVAVSENQRYPLAERVQTLQEFHKRLSAHAGIALALARLLHEQGELEEATELMWLALDGEDLDLQRGLTVCRELLASSPEHGDLRLVLHDLLLRQGHGEEALAALPETDALPPQRMPELSRRFAAQRQRVMRSSALAVRFAEVLRRDGKRDEAMETLRAAAESASLPEAIPLWTELARAFMESGRRTEGRAILERLAGQGESPEALYQSIEAWAQERLARETQALRARLQRHPEATEAALDLAEHLLRLGNSQEARGVLSDAPVPDELRPRRACLLARAHMDAGEYALAEAVLRPLATAGAAAPNGAGSEIQFRLAECAERHGRHAEAHARYLALADDSHFGEYARERARRSYARYLSEAAGELRAVLERVSTL